LRPSGQTPGKSLRTTGRVAAWICAIAVALFAGCDFPGKPTPADRPVSPENVLNFTEIYKRNCAGCHGADGKLGPAPPLNDSLFRSLVPETELERVVVSGRQGTPMPAFSRANGGALTPAQVLVLVHGIKGIPDHRHESEAQVTGGAKAADGEGAAPAWETPKPLPKNAPAYLLSRQAANHTSGEYERIRTTVFAQACAGCHGEHGKGDKSAINDASFLALISNQGLRRLIITGRPDLGMPDYAGTDGRDPEFRPLTSRDVDDLVDLLASWRTSGAADTDHRRQTASR
jgi:cytochrome c oxidase cbb3-type subunit 3